MSDEELSDDEYDQRRASQVPPKPLREHPLCSKCDHVVKPFYGKCPHCEGVANQTKVGALADVIRELKQSASEDIDPERERQLLKLLDSYGHPDARGFLAWLSDQRNQPKMPKRGKYDRR